MQNSGSDWQWQWQLNGQVTLTHLQKLRLHFWSYVQQSHTDITTFLPHKSLQYSKSRLFLTPPPPQTIQSSFWSFLSQYTSNSFILPYLAKRLTTSTWQSVHYFRISNLRGDKPIMLRLSFSLGQPVTVSHRQQTDLASWVTWYIADQNGDDGDACEFVLRFCCVC